MFEVELVSPVFTDGTGSGTREPEAESSSVWPPQLEETTRNPVAATSPAARDPPKN